MGTAGIQKALIKDAPNVKTYGSTSLVELDSSQNSLTAFIDETCLGRNTTNPQKTMSDVKWLLIRQHVWLNYKNLYPQLRNSAFFEKLLTELEATDYTILQGNNIVINRSQVLKSNSDGNLGSMHMLMPYTNFPEYEIGNIFLVAIDSPKVLYAQFKFPENGYIPLENKDKKAAYGQTVDVVVYTHLLPDWRRGNMEFQFEVELVNKDNVVAKSGVKALKSANFGYNCSTTLKFFIDPEWQKGHADKNKNEEYFLRMKGHEAFSTPVFTSPDTQYISGEHNSEIDTRDWMKMVRGKWVYDSSHVLLVPFDTFSDMMSKFEVQKNEMIQYIGDIRYTKKEFDPCGYSKITVKDEGDKDRDAFVIFDEDDTTNPIDRTAQTFSIIAGDERKNVSITLDKLTTTDTFCQGLLLETGQKHSEKKNVFQVGKVIPAMRSKDGNYPMVKDSSQEGDYDVQADNTRGPSGDVSQLQQWSENVDYKFDSNEKMTLMLRYLYNKSVADGSRAQNIALDAFWVFRYIWPNESQAQLYFVPVSTCRYPNQIVKIKVYPDVEWEVALSYNYSNPLAYNHGNLTTYNVEGTLKRYQGLSQQEYNLQTQQATLGQFKLGLFNPKVNGNDLIKAEFEFAEKIRKVCAVFLKMKKIADTVTYGTEGGADLLRAKKFPFDFEIKSPSTGIKITWGNKVGTAPENKHKVGLEGNLDWYASPLIGADLTLKIHEMVKYIPHPLAKLIDGIITGFNKLNSENLETKFEVNLVFSGELNANINAFQINMVDTRAQLSSEKNEKSYIEGVFTVKLEVILVGKGKVTIPYTSYEFNFGAKAEAYLKAYWDAKLFLTNQKDGLFGQFSGGFSGLKGKIIVEIIAGPMTFTVYDKEDTWFEPDDANPESDVNSDEGQKPLMIPLIEAAK